MLGTVLLTNYCLVMFFSKGDIKWYSVKSYCIRVINFYTWFQYFNVLKNQIFKFLVKN